MTRNRVDAPKFYVSAVTDTATGAHMVCLLLGAMGDLEPVAYGLDPDVARQIGDDLIAASLDAELSRELSGEGAHGGGSDRPDDPA
jgi:hypothetical protein